MKIITIHNAKYSLILDTYIDHTRRDVYFIVEKAEYNKPGSYKKYTYSTGKAAFKKFDELQKMLFDLYGIM